jgi:hypothetical protein
MVRTTVALTLCLSGHLLFCSPAASEEPVRKGHLTISKATTAITSPLDKDGYPDYAAALNERMRQGVLQRRRKR